MRPNKNRRSTLTSSSSSSRKQRRSLLACAGNSDHQAGIDNTSSSSLGANITHNNKDTSMTSSKRKSGGFRANRNNNTGKKNPSKNRTSKGSGKSQLVSSNTKGNTLKKKTKKPQTFLSVLSQPFVPWNELERVIGDFYGPEWSHTVRSYIVQHLVRFLELKILTEEFATEALLAPSPLLAQAWQAVLLDGILYTQVIHDIQDFHERPHQLLKFSLRRTTDLVAVRGAGTEDDNKEEEEAPDSEEDAAEKHQRQQQRRRLERTQHLFQAYYGEPMLTSVDDIDTDGSILTDTSTITDMMGLYLPRCGGEVRPSDPNNANKCHKSGNGGGWWSGKCLEALSDVLFFHPLADDTSVAPTVLIEELEEALTPEERTEYDSLFTFDFLHTRHYLSCRRDHGSGSGSGSGECGGGADATTSQNHQDRSYQLCQSPAVFSC